MADTKISALSAASALAGGEQFGANQGGSSVAVTANQIAAFIQTPNSSVVVPAMICAVSSSTLSLGSNTNVQKLFNVSANGAVAVVANTTYFWKCSFAVTGMSATSGNLGFSLLGAGTASITSNAFWSGGVDASTLSTAAAGGFSFNTVATSSASGNLVTAATGTGVAVDIDGVVRINAGGTLIPSIQLTTANAATVSVNAFLWMFPIGSGTVTTVGTWT